MPKFDLENMKKSPTVLFSIAFFVVVIIMFIANQSKDVEVALEMPFNEGIRSLSTYGNSLMAVSSDNKIFVWDWDELSKKTRTGSVESQQAVLLEGDLVASLRLSSPRALIVTNIEGDKKHKEIPLGLKEVQGTLIFNRNRSFIGVVLEESSNGEALKSYKLLSVDVEAGSSSKIMDLSEESSGDYLTVFAVSDDGGFIAGVGKKDHRARLVLVDIKQWRMLWDKTYDNPDRFGSVFFSFDSKTIFAGGSDGAVYWFRVSDGKLVDQFRFKGEAAIAHKTISIQHMTISPDSSLLAYTYGFKIYIFDCKTKREIHSQSTGHKLPGSLAFSPDSRFVATSDLRQGGNIRIWQIPQY